MRGNCRVGVRGGWGGEGLERLLNLAELWSRISEFEASDPLLRSILVDV